MKLHGISALDVPWLVLYADGTITCGEDVRKRRCIQIRVFLVLVWLVWRYSSNPVHSMLHTMYNEKTAQHDYFCTVAPPLPRQKARSMGLPTLHNTRNQTISRTRLRHHGHHNKLWQWNVFLWAMVLYSVVRRQIANRYRYLCTYLLCTRVLCAYTE